MAVRVGNQPAFPVRLYPPNSEYAPVEPRGLSVLVYFVASPARGTSFAFADRAATVVVPAARVAHLVTPELLGRQCTRICLTLISINQSISIK